MKSILWITKRENVFIWAISHNRKASHPPRSIQDTCHVQGTLHDVQIKCIIKMNKSCIDLWPLNHEVDKNDYLYRYWNTEPKSQSGLLFPWGFYVLCPWLHDDAGSGLFSAWMEAVVDSYGCLRHHLHPSVVVRGFLLQMYAQGKQKKRQSVVFAKFPGSFQSLLAGCSLKGGWKMLKSSWELLQKQVTYKPQTTFLQKLR